MDPMLAKTIPRGDDVSMFLEDSWWMQPKIDGERLLIVSDGTGKVRCFNRDGQPTIGPAAAVAEIAEYPLPITIDGERLGETYVVFDLVDLNGQGAGVPMADRLKLLTSFVELWEPKHLQLIPTARTVEEKAAMMRQVTAREGEGWLLKRPESLYEPGVRAQSWRKLKRYRDVDCVVAWVGDQNQPDQKDNMGLSMYDEDGELVNVGECTRRAGHGQRVQPGDVVMVQVLYASDNNRLVQTTKPRIRTDKPARQCTLDQLDDIRTCKDFVLSWDDNWETRLVSGL